MEVKEKTTAPADSLAKKRGKMTFRDFILKYYAILFLVIVFVAASLISPIFLTSQNLFTVLRQRAVYLIIAMGMLMVIITAGIDLAAASVATLSSIILAGCFERWGIGGNSFLGIWGVIILAVATATVVGCINGFLVAKLRMPAFIVTLATNYACDGICYIITKGTTIMLNSSGLAYQKLVYPGFAFQTFLKVPYMVILAVIIVLIFHFVMKYTTFGRMVYAIGSNENAVQLAGINSKKYLFFVYLLEGMLCGIAGVLMVCRSGNASALSCNGDYAMSTIAGVVLGGASLAGGEGTVALTVVGVMIIAIISNVMNLINLPSYPQEVVMACIIIFAVLLKSVSSKKQG